MTSDARSAALWWGDSVRMVNKLLCTCVYVAMVWPLVGTRRLSGAMWRSLLCMGRAAAGRRRCALRRAADRPGRREAGLAHDAGAVHLDRQGLGLAGGARGLDSPGRVDRSYRVNVSFIKRFIYIVIMHW